MMFSCMSLQVYLLYSYTKAVKERWLGNFSSVLNLGFGRGHPLERVGLHNMYPLLLPFP